jgi:hypothetical protein
MNQAPEVDHAVGARGTGFVVLQVQIEGALVGKRAERRVADVERAGDISNAMQRLSMATTAKPIEAMVSARASIWSGCR